MIGANDADILVSLSENHHPTADYVRELREVACRASFPGLPFYFLPADIVTQILNFGLPAPIDIQIEGADVRSTTNRGQDADRVAPGVRVSRILRIQQPLDYPTLRRRRGPHQGIAGRATPNATSPPAC